MSDDRADTDVKMRRELLASAAERRLGWSPRAEDNSEQSSNYEDQGAFSSFDIDLSQPLFRM